MHNVSIDILKQQLKPLFFAVLVYTKNLSTRAFLKLQTSLAPGN